MPETSPFEIVAGNNAAGLVLLADHATNHLPAEYGRLGLPESAFSRHIAYDIGVEALVRRLARRLAFPPCSAVFPGC